MLIFLPTSSRMRVPPCPRAARSGRAHVWRGLRPARLSSSLPTPDLKLPFTSSQVLCFLLPSAVSHLLGSACLFLLLLSKHALWLKLTHPSGHKLTITSLGKPPLLPNNLTHYTSLQLLMFSQICQGTSLVVQWLRLCSQCRGPGFDPWSGN